MKAKKLKEHGGIGICSPSHVAKIHEYRNTLNGIRYFGFNPIESDDLSSTTKNTPIFYKWGMNWTISVFLQRLYY